MEDYSTRQNKISRLLHREIADIILKINKTKYPGKLITVSAVRITKDLGISRIYFSIFPSEFASEIISEFKMNNKQIRGELGKKVGKNLRIVPELEFYIDDSLDYIDNINKLLHS